LPIRPSNDHDVRADLPELQASIDGNDADRCVHLLPRVRGLRRVAAAETGRLLRVLFLRLGSLSPDPGQLVMLRDAGQPIGAEGACVEARADWASGLRGCLTWGVPIAILLATPRVGERYLVIVWTALLKFMGVACWLNARRCGRIHCYVTGPFFLLLTGLATLFGRKPAGNRFESKTAGPKCHRGHLAASTAPVTCLAAISARGRPHEGLVRIRVVLGTGLVGLGMREAIHVGALVDLHQILHDGDRRWKTQR
jgi:hypothetical protein